LVRARGYHAADIPRKARPHIPLNASTLGGSNADISPCSREFSFCVIAVLQPYPYAVGGRHRKGHGTVVEPENNLRIEAPRSILMLSKLQSRTKCATAVLVLPLIKMLYFDFILVAFMVQETRMIANRVLLTERHIALAISGTE
jgi:hypothetical protein